MLMLLRQLLSILALPFTVIILIPLWIARRNHLTIVAPHDVTSGIAFVLGIALLAAGLILFSACLYYFSTRGRGTLAPWDPPRQFVVEGPYRFVRNPMISGVILMLIGEACVVRSARLGAWAATFFLINLVYIPLFEEPALSARFGEPYARYRGAVRRFTPRFRPWTAEGWADTIR